MRASATLGALALLAIGLVPVVASAQPESVRDIVRLADGSFYRGVIIERTDEHVLLQMPSGDVRDFACADVVTAEREVEPVSTAEVPPPRRSRTCTSWPTTARPA